jgi:hypothetical protein
MADFVVFHATICPTLLCIFHDFSELHRKKRGAVLFYGSVHLLRWLFRNTQDFDRSFRNLELAKIVHETLRNLCKSKNALQEHF